MERTQWIAAMALVLVAGALVLGRFSSVDAAIAESADSTADAAPTTTAPPPVITEPERLGPAKDFVALDGWLQTDAENLDDFDGQVRIVQFWTFGCHNCTATIPHLQEIYETWHPQGLEILAIHSPEFEYEKDPAAISEAAERLGVTWPIAMDTNKLNFGRWQTGRRFWPRTYVVDQAGELRYDHIGEGQYDELAATVAYLMENGP